jgi:site-specific recombinase XerD
MQHYSEISRDITHPWPYIFNIRCGKNPTEQVFCWIMDPQAILKTSRRRDRIIQALTQEEVRRLFDVITNKRDCALVRVAYRHGLRASEVGLLSRNDADLRTGRLTVHRLKGSLSGVYPMQPDTQKLLKAYLRSRKDVSPYLFMSNRQIPISRYAVWHLMQYYGEAAGLPPEKRTFHILKHSIATHLLDAGADLAFVRDWLGHANIQNTLVYARVTTVKRDAEARRLFASPWVV